MKRLAALIFVLTGLLYAIPAQSILFSGAGCWGTAADGWTVICATTGVGAANSCYTPSRGNGTYTGTCITYVSDSLGNDANNCIAPPPVDPVFATPCKTLATGKAFTRAGKPDWILLKAGDTWVGQQFGDLNSTGVSQMAPMLVSSYPLPVVGSGIARPIIQTAGIQQCIGAHATGSPGYTAVIGIECYAYTLDPGNVAFSIPAIGSLKPVGFSFGNPHNWLLLEGNKVSFFSTNMELDGVGGNHARVIVRRNVIVDAWDWLGHRQGLHTFNTNSGGLLVEENVFDRNGWNETLNAQSTGITITSASPAVVTWGGFVGSRLQNQMAVALGGTLPTGLTAYNPEDPGNVNKYYCVANYSAGTFNLKAPHFNGVDTSCDGIGSVINTTGLTTTTATIRWIDPGKTIFDRNMYSDATVPQAIVQNNINTRSASEGIQLRGGGNIIGDFHAENSLGFFYASTLSLASGNVVMNAVDIINGLSGGPRGNGILALNGSVAGSTITNNIVKDSTAVDTTNAYGINIENVAGGQTVTNNIVCAIQGRPTISNTGGGSNTITGNHEKSADCAAGGWTGTQPTLVDVTRGAGSYNAQISGCGSLPGGCTATLDAFMTSARAQSKTNWNSALTAMSLVAYIRAGFGL